MLIGVVLVGWTSNRLSRRLTIVLVNVFFLVGPLPWLLLEGTPCSWQAISLLSH
jgi:hypothetical protein